MSRYIPVILFGLAMLGAGCGEPTAPSPTRRGIISYAPSITETVFALGQGARVVAVTNYCDYPPEVESIPKVGGYMDPDAEKITMLAPELMIIQGRHQKVVDIAAKNQIRLLNVNMDSLAGIDAGIATIGEALGCVPQADELRRKVAQELDAVRQAVAGLPPPRVLIINTRTNHDLNNLFSVGRQSFVSEVVEAAGGENVFADSPEEYFEASKESVVMKRPEVILEFHAGENLSEAEQARFVADWNQLPSLPAVRDRRVHLFLKSYGLRPGPRIPLVARTIAGWLHPDVELPAP
ncbi:MAG: ABC transporter substrate-binding protein [Candidatus Hydrogenedentes bacterium]|nr:ABC transporter substrate-binding protein [Candidatus Hydrogenedentota bacterium]